MREIKFRAWDKDDKEMICGINKYLMNWDGLNCNINRFFDGELPVMQYTGLKDKNCREIYEGDILDIGEPQIKKRSFGVVTYQQGYFGYNAPWLVGEEPPIPLKEYCNEIFKECVKIVGNIYENPEFVSNEVGK